MSALVNENRKSGLIRTRQTAIGILILTAFVSALTFRVALSHQAHQPHWLLPLGDLLPTWALWAVNIAFYVYLGWLCLVFFRVAVGKERLLVGGWFFIILLSPLQSLVSESAVVLIQYIKVLSMAVALVAGVLLVAKRNVADTTTSG
jgi:hypothetical protein